MNNEMPDVLYIRPTHSDGKHFSCSLQSDTLKRTKYVRADKAVPEGWRDISTAPMDGKYIIVFRPVYDGQYIPQVGGDYFKKWFCGTPTETYKAMLSAAPQPPKEGEIK